MTTVVTLSADMKVSDLFAAFIATPVYVWTEPSLCWIRTVPLAEARALRAITNAMTISETAFTIESFRWGRAIKCAARRAFELSPSTRVLPVPHPTTLTRIREAALAQG